MNIERLKEIHSVLPSLPLVLHGGSQTPLWQVQEAIRNGIRKVNICTDIVLAMWNQYIETKNKTDLKVTTANIFTPSNKAAYDLITKKIRAFALIDKYGKGSNEF